MNEREKCEKLKELRKKVSKSLDIDLNQTECKFEGNCTGTCPKCKSEEKKLNAEIAKRLAAGTLTAAILTISLSGCTTSKVTPVKEVPTQNQEAETKDEQNDDVVFENGDLAGGISFPESEALSGIMPNPVETKGPIEKLKDLFD